MALVDDLKAAREWLSDRNHWCKRTTARFRNGRSWDNFIWANHPRVEQTCLIGAYQHVTGQLVWGAFSEALKDCIPPTPTGKPRAIATFNDNPKTKHEDVLRVLDCAIEKASSV